MYTNCGGPAAMFLEEITTNQRPPVCQPLKPKYNSQQGGSRNGATSREVTSATMLCSVLLMIGFPLKLYGLF